VIFFFTTEEQRGREAETKDFMDYGLWVMSN
jgi:hypothetical protein